MTGPAFPWKEVERETDSPAGPGTGPGSELGDRRQKGRAEGLMLQGGIYPSTRALTI